MQRLLLIWLVGWGCFGTEAQGQRRITEEEFLDRLNVEHVALSGEAAAVDLAAVERLRAGVVEDPQLGFVREEAGDSGYERTAILAWTPPLDGRRGPAVEAADTGIAAAEARQRAGLMESRARMRAAFAGWLAAVERHELLQASLGGLEEVVRSVTARSDKGEESRLAAGRVQLSAVGLRNLLGVVESERARALAAVRTWDASIGEDDRPVGPRLEAFTGVPDLEARADLEALRLDLEQAMLEQKRNRRFIEFPELVFGWKEIGAADVDFDGPVYGLNWSVPIGDRGRSGKAAGEARLTLAEGTLEFETARAGTAVEAAAASYRVLLETWQESHDLIEGNGWMAEAAVARYQSGEDSLTDLLDTLRSVLSARLADTEMFARVLEAHRDLELAIGRPLVAPFATPSSKEHSPETESAAGGSS